MEPYCLRQAGGEGERNAYRHSSQARWNAYNFHKLDNVPDHLNFPWFYIDEATYQLLELVDRRVWRDVASWDGSNSRLPGSETNALGNMTSWLPLQFNLTFVLIKYVYYIHKQVVILT